MPKTAKPFNVWMKIRAALRKIWMYSPQRAAALKAARREDGTFLCPLCKDVYEKWGMDVDHIVPCGELTESAHLEGFTNRLFNGPLQAICKPCHKAKPKPKRSKHA